MAGKYALCYSEFLYMVNRCILLLIFVVILLLCYFQEPSDSGNSCLIVNNIFNSFFSLLVF